MKPEDFVGAGDGWLGDDPVPDRKKSSVKSAQTALPVEYAVAYVPVYCPNCGSRNCPAYVSRTGDPTRYHKCALCNQNFKSVEILPEWVKRIRLEYEKRRS